MCFSRAWSTSTIVDRDEVCLVSLDPTDKRPAMANSLSSRSCGFEGLGDTKAHSHQEPEQPQKRRLGTTEPSICADPTKAFDA